MHKLDHRHLPQAPNMFPYISQIHVRNCFARKRFNIPLVPLTEFRHIILTGKNGSGKTTILDAIGAQLGLFRSGTFPSVEIDKLSAWASNKEDKRSADWTRQIEELRRVALSFVGTEFMPLVQGKDAYLFAHFKANRRVQLAPVSTITRETEVELASVVTSRESTIATQLKQFLVNKKVYAAFDALDGNTQSKEASDSFFGRIDELFQRVMEDQSAHLQFVQREFEFYVHLANGQRFTLNQMSEGYSAFFAIFIELLARMDILRRHHKDEAIEPFGIVVIDEPETHFHLKLQYEILPLLTLAFPKIQFIVATHSPAVASSVQNAIVIDLSSEAELNDDVVGSSYSALMLNHFGLDNEFSDVADRILKDVSEAYAQKDLERMRTLLFDNEKYLTASLRLEIESMMIRMSASHD